MRRRRFLLSAVTLLAAAGLPSCGRRSAEFRYRMTVIIETPQGLRSGSSVIEITRTQTTGGPFPEARGTNSYTKGEAVSVNLPNGAILVALLRTPDIADGGITYPLAALETPEFNDDYPAIKMVHYLRQHKPGGVLPTRSWPIFVYFRNPEDPYDITRIDPKQISQVFGPGYRVRQINIDITDDDVTDGLKKTLPWLSDISYMRRTGGEIPADIPSGDFYGLFRRGFDK